MGRIRTTSGGKSLKQTGERNRKHSGPKQTSGNGPRHSLFPLSEREHFRRVREWYGSFSWGIESGEEENEECDETNSRRSG